MKNTIVILIAADGRLIRSQLQKVLAREGYNILLAKDGSEALEIISSRKVDVVLSDMNLSKSSGLELLQSLKRERPEIGVVMMIDRENGDTVKEAILQGADEYLVKPFQNYELTMIIERIYWRILAATNTAPDIQE